MRAQRSKALVRAWLDFLPPAQRPLAERVRELALGAEPALEESIKWGNLVLALEGGRPLLALATHKTGLHLRRLGRSEGAEPAPADRGLRLRHSEPLPEAEILALVRTQVSTQLSTQLSTCVQGEAESVVASPPVRA